MEGTEQIKKIPGILSRLEGKRHRGGGALTGIRTKLSSEVCSAFRKVTWEYKKELWLSE